MNTQEFVSRLQAHANTPLVFEYDHKRIQPGYHVTEVIGARKQGLDCGANPETWAETIVQLWDVAGTASDTHMTTSKFVSIYQKVAAQLPLEQDAKLVFECGTDSSPAAHFVLQDMHFEHDEVIVRLEPKRVSCKPRDRMLAASEPMALEVVTANACCTPTASASTKCCG